LQPSISQYAKNFQQLRPVLAYGRDIQVPEEKLIDSWRHIDTVLGGIKESVG
jgi:hypothetical protein